MSEKTKWVNLSCRDFTPQTYDTLGGSLRNLYLKPATGMWFSLATDSPYESQWGDYLSEYQSLQGEVLDSSRQTHITTVALKDSSYTVDLETWFDEIAKTIQATNKNLDSVEKRKILLDRFRQLTGNPNIEHLIFSLQEKDLNRVADMSKFTLDDKEQEESERHESLKIDWVVDYFSACMNEDIISGYDMPSLALFDTNCVDVLRQQTKTLFEREHTALDIGKDLVQIGRISIERDVLEQLIASRSALEAQIFGTKNKDNYEGEEL